MNKDDINRMWQQSQDDAKGMRLGFTTQQHYFAALVAAAEREACAKLCDDMVLYTGYDCAAAIRARGNA